jgi:hypothetical protein
LRHKVLPHAARDLDTLQKSSDPATKEAASRLKKALAVFSLLALRLALDEDDDGDDDSPDDHGSAF